MIPLCDIIDDNSHDGAFVQAAYGDPLAPILKNMKYLLHLLPGLAKVLAQDAENDEPGDKTIACTQEDIVHILSEKMPELAEQEIRVEFPGLQNTTSLRYRLHLKKPTRVSQGIMGEEAIVSYNWQIAIGEHQVSLKEFERMVAQKETLLRLKDNVIYLDQKKAAQMLAFLKKASLEENISIGQALKKGYAAVDHEDFAFDGIDADPWAELFLKQLKKPDSIPRISPPSNFKGTLRPYQTVGLSWLKFVASCKLGACLADDMGLGKTVQIIAWLSYKKDVLKEIGPTLLICPMSVMSNWQQELNRFNSSLTVMLHHGARRSHDNFFAESIHNITYDIIITSYATAMRDQEFLAAIQWNTIVIDEAQNIKNPEAKQTRAIKSFNAQNKIALTGTPVENRLTELWSIIDFINPGYLGSLRSFNRTFVYPIEVAKDAKVRQKLKDLILPCILRRTKNDKSIIQDLPEKIEQKVYCSLTKEQAALYQGAVKTMINGLKEVKGFARAGQVLRTLTQLKQICNHPDQLLGSITVDPEKSGKIQRFLELLEVVLAESDKVLIFTQFKQMGDILAHTIKKAFNRETLFLHGSCTQKARDGMIASFTQPDGPQVFILSLKAGGTGLNLVQANHVFHIDRWWNPAVENQATDRAYRIGQTKMVQVHKFICKGTLEERIDLMIESKQKLAADIISDSEQWITQLSDTDLEKLVTLDTKIS